MRFWDRVRNPDKPQTRSRSALRPELGSARSQWGQRPMFSESGPDQPPPEEGRLATEAKLDSMVPSDKSKGSQAHTDLIKDEAAILTAFLPVSLSSVSNPPKTTELDNIFKTPRIGYAALVVDGGGGGLAWFVIRRTNNQWGYELLTSSVD